MGSGISFVFSCGDNLSVNVNADAAIDAVITPDAASTCDCLAAEPALAGRFVVVSQISTIAANAHNAAAPTCPAGTQPLFGSCTTDLPSPIRNVTLEQAGIYFSSPQDWFCWFRNHESVPVTIRASAICLKPAS